MYVNVDKVANLRNPKYAWRVKTPTMPAPAFWYYRTQEEAERDAEYLRTRQ